MKTSFSHFNDKKLISQSRRRKKEKKTKRFLRHEVQSRSGRHELEYLTWQLTNRIVRKIHVFQSCEIFYFIWQFCNHFFLSFKDVKFVRSSIV